MLLSGSAGALGVRHADGSPYGAGVTAAAANADVSEKVFGALRGLGFKETEAKRALAQAFAEHDREDSGDPGDVVPWTAKALLKCTLMLLGSSGRP